MKAVCWYGKEDVRVQEVPDPQILQPTDAIVEITLSAICGSDLHIYGGFIPFMKPGDILGHEAMGIVREVGSAVEKLKVGDRIVIPFPIACGECWYCQNEQWSLCDNSNPKPEVTQMLYGGAGAGQFGYSHAYGGFAGAQAEYIRVPYADHVHVKVPESLTDEQALFLSDVLPTGWFAADCANIQVGDNVAVWGAGPVGQFTMLAARMMGAADIFAIDPVPERLMIAEEAVGAIPLDHEDLGMMEVQHELRLLTGGRGPDSVVDAVGIESTDGALGVYHKVKQALHLEQDRPIALTEAIMACRKGGTVSVPGVFTGMIDKFPMGAVFAKGLELRGGQAPVQRYADDLVQRIERGEMDPSYIITHWISLDDVPEAYAAFRDAKECVLKVVIEP